MRAKSGILLLTAALLFPALFSACGFHLRGDYSLPYRTLYLALPAGAEVGVQLKQMLASSANTKLIDSPLEADATLIQLLDNRDRIILSIDTSGRAREVRLRLRYAYRIVDAKGRELVPASTIELIRDMTYDDSYVLAKGQEEALLWNDLQQELGQQLLRRLSATPRPAGEAETADDAAETPLPAPQEAR